MEANNKFAATLEKHFQDVPRCDELYRIKKVVRKLKLSLKVTQDRERANTTQLDTAAKLGNQVTTLEACLRVVGNERKSTLERVSLLEAQIVSSSIKHADDIRHVTHEARS